VGVTCYPWGKERYKRANEFVDKEIVAKDFPERIAIVLREADAFVVFPGGTGTLMELAAALEYINKGLLEPKPIIMLGDFWKPVFSCLQNEPVFSKKLNGKISCVAELVTFVNTADECIEQLK
jgi:predicted Rossmann-fold nucleotide-binding protein